MGITHIPFYPSDWLAGTRSLTADETGVYITLLAQMYEMAGPIERNDERLFRLCGCKTKTSYLKILDYLMSQGKIVAVDGSLYNDRVQKEIKVVVGKSMKAAEAAQARWNKKPNKNNAKGDATASPKHVPQHCYPEPEPEPYKDQEPYGSLSFNHEVPFNPAEETAEAIKIYNETAERAGWPLLVKLTNSRRLALKSRLKDADGLQGWRGALAKAEASNHCCGQNNRGWTADFDFLVKESSFTKLMEGSYDNRTQFYAKNPSREDPNQPSPPGFANEISNTARSY